MDPLKKMVHEYDMQRNSLRQMRATERPAGLLRICFGCRQSPDAERYREDWLRDHPLPRRYCSRQCRARNSFNTRPAHKRWHEDLYVGANMPPFASLGDHCQFCGGKLVEVVR